MSFKETWELKDKTCPSCNQVTERVKGITKQNLRNLLVPKWTTSEVLITILLITLILLALVYKSETAQSREWLNSMVNSPKGCYAACNDQCDGVTAKLTHSNETYKPINMSNLKFAGTGEK